MKNNDGFVVVASRKKAFYYSALNLIESIRDYMPDAKFALFTEPQFMDERCDDIDYVYPCGDHIREKLYGIMHSPFDRTFYIDADCVVEHEDIIYAFDQLKNNDIVFVRLTDDEVAKRSFVEQIWEHPIDGPGKLTLCGGVCLYNNSNPLVKDFMKDWHNIFMKQENEGWCPEGYPKSLMRWDQFSLWWLTNKVDKYKNLKIGKFDDNYRWNWFTSFGIDSKGNHRLVNNHPIIFHHSASMKKDANYD